MGNFQHEPVMPAGTHIGYVEGYIDALEKVLDFQKRHPTMTTADICYALRISMRTFVLAGNQVTLPENLASFPSTEHLIHSGQ